MNEAIEEFKKKLDAFIDKQCFKVDKKTGKKELTPFGVKLLFQCCLALYVSALKLRNGDNIKW